MASARRHATATPSTRPHESRRVSRVNGVRSTQDQDTLSKLWLHESQRVFYDRLINFEDQQWFERLACELLSRHLGQMLSADQIFGENSVLFCDFMKAGVDVENRRYELGGIDKITALLGDARQSRADGDGASDGASETTMRRAENGAYLTVGGVEVELFSDMFWRRTRKKYGVPDDFLASTSTFSFEQLKGEAGKGGGKGKGKRRAAPAAQAPAGPKCRGKVKKMVRDRGFGFIRGEDGKEVFFHRSGLNAAEYDSLSEGDDVEYVVQEGPRGARAENVKHAGASES